MKTTDYAGLEGETMTFEEYCEYETDFADFMKRENITNLTAEIGEDTDHACVICGEIVGCDPWFSRHPCDCCGTRLGGDRVHATGYNPETKEGQCYAVCWDCIYYAEYGRLDDMTMSEVENSSK